jgi:hypothetical protein
MKGAMNRGFITYLLLFLGMIIGVVLVCLTIMMFSPGVPILGYMHYLENSRTTIKNFNGIDMVEHDGKTSVILNAEGQEIQPVQNPTSIYFVHLEKVIIKTNGMDVNFIHGPENRIDVVHNISGFAKAEDFPEFVITKQYNSETKTLTITAYDQTLLFTLSNDSYINVIIPDNTPNLAFEVETKSGAITFATQEFSKLVARDLQASSFKATTETGKIAIADVAVIKNKLELKATKSSVKLHGALGSANNKLSNITFDIEDGDITTQNLFANTITFKGKATYVSSKKITANINLAIEKGNFEVEEVQGNVIDSDEIVKSTRIVINKVQGEFTIPSSHGTNIILGQATGTVYVRSQSGAVTVKEALGLVDIQTTSGMVTVLFNSVADANITTDTGAIKLAFVQMKGAKNITSTKGNITVYHKDDLAFKLVATSQGKIDLVSESLQFEKQTITGYPTQIADEFETANVLTLTTGNATISVTRKLTIDWNVLA